MKRGAALVLGVGAVMVLAMVGGPLWADMVGRQAPEIEAQQWMNSGPLSLKALRGKIVVVEFWATWCGPCRQSIPHLNELHKKFSGQGVVVIGLTDEPKGEVERFAREVEIAYPIGTGSQTGGLYGVSGIPHAFIVDPSGKIAWEGHPMVGLDEALQKQIRETPPILVDPKEHAAAMALLDRIEKALEEQKFAEAAAMLAKVRGTDKDPDVRQRVEAAKAVLARVADERLAEAEKYIEAEDYYEASVALEALSNLMPGSEQAERAKQRLAELMADEEIRAAIEKGRREHQAAAILAEIRKDEEKKDPAELLKALEKLAEQYPDTEAGKEAAERAQKMRADPNLVNQLKSEAAEHECKGWLSMARSYISAGLPEKAKPYLEDILKKYPDSPYAEEARKLLAEIEGK